MSNESLRSTNTGSDQPLSDFSSCHVGILNQLQGLGELPALLEAAERAPRLAAQALQLFQEAILVHHNDEERELFPAVLASAAVGTERDKVQSLVDRLTTEHRNLEARWKAMEPELKKVVQHKSSTLSPVDVAELVQEYRAHAAFEEAEFLPLSQTILGRDSNHLAALGMSLHTRHLPAPVLYI